MAAPRSTSAATPRQTTTFQSWTGLELPREALSSRRRRSWTVAGPFPNAQEVQWSEIHPRGHDLSAARARAVTALCPPVDDLRGQAPLAHAAEAERIVVTNAHLIGRDAASKDVRINLIIVSGKLVVVTKDDLVIEPGDIAVDANAGFLLGQLVLGARPRFVILDQDPREEFDVLLDTGEHVRFAVEDGVVVKNELPEALPSPPDATPKPRRWVAYTPPPIAVPIRYYDSRKWNKFNTKPISGLFTGALALDRQFWLSQDGDSETQVGDLSEFEGGKIRAFRVRRGRHVEFQATLDLHGVRDYAYLRQGIRQRRGR